MKYEKLLKINNIIRAMEKENLNGEYVEKCCCINVDNKALYHPSESKFLSDTWVINSKGEEGTGLKSFIKAMKEIS